MATTYEPKTGAGQTLEPQPIARGYANNRVDSLVTGVSDRLAKPWKISDKLLPFLGEWESGVLNGKNYKGHLVTDGMILSVYLDSKGLPTVGCGHLIQPADNLKMGDTITLEKAKEFLRNDLKTMEAAVNKKVLVPLYQYEYDALVSTVFNTGPSAPADSLAKLINTNFYENIPKKLSLFWTNGGTSNVGRRKSEADLFKMGVYNAKH